MVIGISVLYKLQTVYKDLSICVHFLGRGREEEGGKCDNHKIIEWCSDGGNL